MSWKIEASVETVCLRHILNLLACVEPQSLELATTFVKKLTDVAGKCLQTNVYETSTLLRFNLFVKALI